MTSSQDQNTSRSALRSLSIPKVLLLILLAGIVARLYQIGEPVLGHHGQRQVDTAAIARNFHEGAMNILYPQIDWRGSSPGYVESEFPAYAYLVALLYHAFGVHDWLGRVVNIALYTFSGLLFFFLTRRLFDKATALLAVVFYSFLPLSYYFTRTFQPDALMVFCSLVGLYFFWRWTEQNRLPFLALSAFGISLAVLIKPACLYLAVPLLYLAQRRFGWGLFRRPVLYLFAVAVVAPALLWYSHAAQLWHTYGNTLFRMYLAMGIPSLTDRVWLSLGKRLLLWWVYLIVTPAGLVFLLVGFFKKPPTRNYLLHWWVVGFGISMALGARAYVGHDYYQLPMTFVSSAWLAYGATALWNNQVRLIRLSKVAIAALCLSMAGFSIWQLHWWIPMVKKNWDRVAFGERVNQLTEPGTLVVFLGSNPSWTPPEWFQHRTAQGEILFWDPVDFYFSHRKGWSVDHKMATPEFMETLRGRGARYFATFFPHILRQNPDLQAAVEHSYIPIEVTPKWAIYRLDQPRVDHDEAIRSRSRVGPHVPPTTIN